MVEACRGVPQSYPDQWLQLGSIRPNVPDHRRKFRSQTSDNMDRWKAEMGRVREEKRREEKRREEERRSKRRKSQKEEDPGARKGRKVAKHCVFSVICGSGGSKSRLAKARFQVKSVKNWRVRTTREAHCQVRMYKAHQLRTTFGSWDVEKVHAVVARSTFRSQQCKKLRGMEHFWTFRYRLAWQAQGIVHLVKSEQNVSVL